MQRLVRLLMLIAAVTLVVTAVVYNGWFAALLATFVASLLTTLYSIFENAPH